MAKRIKQDLTSVNAEELNHELESNQLKLTKMKFNHAISPLEDTNVIKQTKKEIARIKTELRKRVLTNQV